MSVSGTMRLTLGNLNPFRYRGYYFDQESGLYYLNARYDDPEIGRYVNSDKYLESGYIVLGNNLFTYCFNNPVRYADPSGEFVITATAVATGFLLVGVFVLTVVAAVAIQYAMQELLEYAWTQGNTALQIPKEQEIPVTGKTELKEVLQTFVNETNELVTITVNGEFITCTPEHPFYSPQKGWTGAVQLRAGDILVLSNGEYVTVEKVQHEMLEAPVKVYNFEVADFHTYFVGKSSVLVHNKCSTGTKKPWDIRTNARGCIHFTYQGKNMRAYLDSKGYYWSEDLAGHGGSAFKVFRKVGRRLEWIHDADQYGNWIEDKHKGPHGRTIYL